MDVVKDTNPLLSAVSKKRPAKPGHAPLVYWASGGTWDGTRLVGLLNGHDPEAAGRRRGSSEKLSRDLLSALAQVERLMEMRNHGVNVAGIDAQMSKTAAAAVDLATEALRLGLEIRRNLMIERNVFDFLLDIGGTLPAVPRVCADCDMVFEPVRRKGAGAYKCPACHGTPRPSWTITPEKVVSVAPTVGSAGTHQGWRKRVWIFCRGCGTIFEAKAENKAPHCSDKCRRRIERGRTIEPGQPLI